MTKTKWVFIDQEKNFKLYIRQPGYRTLVCSSNSYWEDVNTQENCGQTVSLAIFLYNNDGSLNKDCYMEENHYRLVTKED